MPVPLTTNSIIRGTAGFGTGGDYSGIRVIAHGPYGEPSILTDQSGDFLFTGMGNGTYCLEYNKEGYGTLLQYSIQLFGNDTVTARGVTLYELPGSLKLPVFKRAFIGVRPRAFPEHDWICFETDVTRLNSDKYGFQFLMCMATGENVSIDHNQLIWFYWNGQYNNDNYFIYIDLLYFNPNNFIDKEFPFKSGEKVYVRGYPCNMSEGYGYLDTYLGVRQFSTLDKTRSTNVISFIMP